MRALRLHGPHDLRLHEETEPAIRPGAVKIRVAAAGICGSDLAFLEHGNPIPEDYVHPQVGEPGARTLGHEFSGWIEETGDGVDGLRVGQLVAVRPNVWDGTCPACLRGDVNLCENWGFVGLHGGGGGFSDYVVVDADQAYPLPQGTSPAVGALVESLAVAWHAAHRADLNADTIALVLGAGPVGLGVLLALKASGVARIIVSEPSESRRALAADLGADVIDPSVDDLDDYVKRTAPGGVDASFEVTGVGGAIFLAALDALRPGGTMVVVAQYHGSVDIDPNVFLQTEKRVTGSYAYTGEDFGAIVEAIAGGRLEPAVLVTSTVSLDDAIVDGFEHLLGGGRNTEVKVIIAPDLAAI
jgi:threonine dehydrogenase-like Zn-dependent dehydrogenase